MLFAPVGGCEQELDVSELVRFVLSVPDFEEPVFRTAYCMKFGTTSVSSLDESGVMLQVDQHVILKIGCNCFSVLDNFTLSTRFKHFIVAQIATRLAR